MLQGSSNESRLNHRRGLYKVPAVWISYYQRGSSRVCRRVKLSRRMGEQAVRRLLAADEIHRNEV
jgi:hypothetical protein